MTSECFTTNLLDLPNLVGLPGWIRFIQLFSPGKRLGCEAPDDDKLLRLDHTSHPVLTIVVTQTCVHMCVCLSGGEVRGCARVAGV